jgi:hypothetical protein
MSLANLVGWILCGLFGMEEYTSCHWRTLWLMIGCLRFVSRNTITTEREAQHIELQTIL